MNNKVLLVDDDLDVISAYQRNLRKYFNITTAASGEEALQYIRVNPPFAVVASDYNMPKMNGVELLSIVKRVSPLSVRVIITGFADLETSIKSVNEGSVFRFLTKPISTDDLISSMKECIEQFRLVNSEKELLENTLKGTIKILVDILGATSPEIFHLAAKIRTTMRDIAYQLNLKNLWEYEIAGLLSFIGCVSIPNEILEKVYKNMDLDDIEKEIYAKHPETGANLIKNIPRFENIAEGIKYQYFNYDGTNSKISDKKADELPLIARLLKVAHDFNYYLNRGFSVDDAILQMKVKSFNYDPKILTSLMVLNNYTAKGFVIKSILFKQLRIGMVLEEDLRDEEDFVLIRKGQELTDIMMLRLINMSKFKKFKEPIRIKEFQN